MQRTFLFLLLLATCLFSGTALAQPLGKYKGKLVISADPTPKTQGEELEKYLQEKSATNGTYTISRSERSFWLCNFVGVLSKDPGGEPMYLVFYDDADKEAQKKFEPIESVELSSKKGTTLLSLSELKISADSGFVEGKTYLVKVTQLKNNKEQILASAKLTLAASK
jgi:hypothetical protein